MSIHDPHAIPDPGGQDWDRISWACACGGGVNVYNDLPGRQTLRSWLAIHRRDHNDPSLPPDPCQRESCTATTTHIHPEDPTAVRWAPQELPCP